jgi:REP element-mobilizing transposase RayT
MYVRPEKPGYSALRRFRESKPGSLYFITTNLAGRGSGLELPDVTGQVFRQWQGIEAAGFWSVRSAVVMPDHIHLLAGLGDSIALAEVMRLFKGRLSSVLRNHGLKWQ